MVYGGVKAEPDPPSDGRSAVSCTNGPKDRTETIDDVLDALEGLGLIEYGEVVASDPEQVVEKSDERGHD